jgi:signal transduction histidine kinase
VHPDDRNRVADKVKEATDNLQQSWQDSYRFKCADGSYKYIQDRGFVVYENGLPVKMIGSLQDISAVKELETRLNDERLQLQKSISETVIEVAENERRRIGHELHDNVNQILSTAKLFVDMIAANSPDQQVLKDKSNDYLALAIEEIRKLSRDLVAPQLKEEKLVDSIRLLIEDIEMTQEMEIRFNPSPDAENLSQGKKVTLFRIVQEQLKNIIKHSQASRTDIQLDHTGDFISLRIVDNGQGFDPRQTHRGIGLSNIYERTKFYNGTVDVDAAPGKGCSITVSLPLTD